MGDGLLREGHHRDHARAIDRPTAAVSLALDLVGVGKSFDGRPALTDASLQVTWGEVHALLGENGAGKTTLMNVACGLYAADAGSIAVDGRPAGIAGPADAARLGLAMVHQNFKLVRRFTVAENVRLACGRKAGLRSDEAAARAIHAQCDELGFRVDPAARVSSLSLAEQQRVEIVKMLLLGARILVLDEPTAVLTDGEAEAILSLLRRLAAQGRAVVLITHKLREVSAYADCVTVMRRGRTVLAGVAAHNLDRPAMIRAMVGEEVSAIAPSCRNPGAVRLEIRDLHAADDDSGRRIGGICLAVHAGEILGIAGVGGNGQSELADLLMGLRQPRQGAILIDGVDVAGRGVREFRARGLRAVPADRYRSGLFADLLAYENTGVTGVVEGRYGGWPRVVRSRMRADAEQAIARYQIHGCNPTTPARLLSGGNAQKLLLARELDAGLSVLVAHSPTRGLDVQATAAVHAALQRVAADGAACVVISEDLEEVFSIATRIAVISRGRLVGEMSSADADRDRVGALMLDHA